MCRSVFMSLCVLCVSVCVYLFVSVCLWVRVYVSVCLCLWVSVYVHVRVCVYGCLLCVRVCLQQASQGRGREVSRARGSPYSEEKETGCKGGQTAEHRRRDLQARASGNGCPCGITDSGTSARGQQPRWLREWSVGLPRAWPPVTKHPPSRRGHQVPGAMLAPKGLKRKCLGPAAREASLGGWAQDGGSHAWLYPWRTRSEPLGSCGSEDEPTSPGNKSCFQHAPYPPHCGPENRNGD